MTQLLAEIFNHDFSESAKDRPFCAQFFDRELTIADLKIICEEVCDSSVRLGGVTIPGAMLIKGKDSDLPPFAVLAALHGNESAGFAGIALAMALAQAGELEHDVIGVAGNPLAAMQYFTAWERNPKARQETRDAYRCGTDDNGALLPDMNRIPVDFLTRKEVTPHIQRARELYTLAQHVRGILDIHTARGNMVCITDYHRERDLKCSPIRDVLTGLADAIGSHASGTVQVQTFKTLAVPLPNMECEIGIEAGRHEDPDAPRVAASFTLSLLHTLGITRVPPLHDEEDGKFTRYAVAPKLTYADLSREGELAANDRVYMAVECGSPEEIPSRSGSVVVRKSDGSFALQSILEFMVKPLGQLCYATYQYDEMEAVATGQVVAVALPSGIALKAPRDFSGIFWSKAARLYDKDPAVGPWPVAADKLATKFCYPCDVSEWDI